MLQLVVGALIGGTVSLVSGMWVRWRERVRDRRTTIWLQTLPKALDSKALFVYKEDSLQELYREAVATSTWDMRQVTDAMLNLAESERVLKRAPEDWEPHDSSDETNLKLTALNDAARDALEHYESALFRKLRKRQWL